MTFKKEPLPMPQPQLYQKRFSEYEDYIVETQNALNQTIGAPDVEYDAWVDVMSTTMDAKAPSELNGTKNPLHYRYRRLAQLGIAFESFDDLARSQTMVGAEEGLLMNRPEPLSYRMQYAFAHGFLQQQYIIDRMYGGAISFDATFQSVADWMNANNPEIESVRDQHEEFGKRIRNFGARGLNATGYARGFIEQWAEQVYPAANATDSHSREAFRTGHGVALQGARIAHEDMNEMLIAAMDMSKIESNAFITLDTTDDKAVE